MENKEEYKKIKQKVQKYTTGMVLPNTSDWLNIPGAVKLSMIQVTPASAVKTRKVGFQEIPYVSVGYVERALNFVTSFQWGVKIIDKGIKEYLQKNSKGEDVEQFDAWVQCDCYAIIDGVKIERSVFGSWKMSKNKAVSDWSVYEAARSQATKSFADTLGIGSDKIWNENEKIEKAREIIEAENIDDLVSNFNGGPTQA